MVELIEVPPLPPYVFMTQCLNNEAEGQFLLFFTRVFAKIRQIKPRLINGLHFTLHTKFLTMGSTIIKT
jgi:hypothetical protein